MPRRGEPLEVDLRIRDLRQILADLKAVEPKLATALRRNIRDAAKVAAKASQDEVRKPPPPRIVRAGSNRPRPASKGSREQAAKGIRVQIATGQRTQGVRIVQTQRGFAKAYNAKRFRHPVFDDGVWVEQQGRPYFGAVIAAHKKDVQAAIEKALDEATRHLNKSY